MQCQSSGRSTYLMLISPCPVAMAAVAKSSEQVRQYEARGFRLHTVNPEIGTAGVVLVASVQQLEVVCLRVERLSEGKVEICEA